MTGVGKTPAQKQNGTCVCQQYDLIWGGHPNVNCAFRMKVVEISKRQNFDPNHFMAVMYVESAHTFSPSKIELKIVGHRKNGKPIYDYVPLTKEEVLKLSENFAGAVGLIQFTPEAITDLNKRYSLSLTKRKLALMTQLDQLDYAEKYIAMWKENNKITTKLTLADLYLVVFSPSKMNGSDDNTILYSKKSKYYESNKSVDKDNTGRAFANAIDFQGQLENRIFNLGGGEDCVISYRSFLATMFEAFGLGDSSFPQKAFAEKNFHCGIMSDCS